MALPAELSIELPPSARPVVAVVQARMGSTRLPGKVLLAVAGQSMLAHVVARLRAATLVDQVVVAIPTGPDDDALAAEATALGIAVVRGSAHDVLARYHQAATQTGAATVVRITADCPLTDPAEVDRVVGCYLAQWPHLDYCSNQLPDQRRVPLGLAVEVFSRTALERAHADATEPWEREHVTPRFYTRTDLFSCAYAAFVEDLSALRLTVDTPQDWAVVSAVLTHLAHTGGSFALADAVAWLRQHPELAAANAEVTQKAYREVQALPLLVLRADASPASGTGHVMRLLGIGQAWIARGGRCALVGRGLALPLQQRLRSANIEVVAWDDESQSGSDADADLLAQLLRERGATAVLVDGYWYAPHWLARLRGGPWRLACVDDYANPNLAADLVVMPNAGAVAPPAALASAVVAGAAYTPLRAEFVAARPPERQFGSDGQPLRLLLTFGGSDPARLSLPAAQAALRIAADVPLHITLLVGPLHGDRAACEQLAHRHRQLQVLQGVTDMVRLLTDTDLALTAGGTTCWELARMGVAMLVCQVADNQQVVLHGLAAAGAALAMPSPGADAAGDIEGHLRQFVAAGPAVHATLGRNAAALIDGAGAQRIAAALAAPTAENPK